MGNGKTVEGGTRHSFVVGCLQQLGWMNAVLCALCAIASMLSFFVAVRNDSTAGVNQSLASATAAGFYGWLWFSIAVLGYGLAHACRLLEEIRDAHRTSSKVTPPSRPAPVAKE